MTYYIKQGNTFSTTAEDNIDIRKELPVGTYMVRFHPEKGYYLEIADDLKIKGKVYGNLVPRAERIISTFKSRPRNTGVLLNGEKGSGKTLLTKKVSEMLIEDAVSTLIVNQQYCGDGFNTFLQSIDEPTAVIFDEFEKVYEPQNQEKILTLLDGVFPSKKLFMLTVNDMKKVDQFMINRPGRLFYSVKYEGLDREFIIEYCNDVLKDTSHSLRVANLASMFRHFNFDMLQSLVEEMNRYNESPKEALAMLNIKPDAARYRDNYTVQLKIPGWEKIDPATLYIDQMEKGAINIYSPLHQEVALHVWTSEEAKNAWYDKRRKLLRDGKTDPLDDGSPDYRGYELENTAITKMDGNGGFYYELADGTQITLTRKAYSTYDYTMLM